MVELRRRLIALGGPVLATVDGDGGAAVIAVDHAIGIVGIDPQAVMIAVGGIEAFERFAAIVRTEQAGVGDVHLVGIFGVRPNVGEIPGTLTKTMIVVNQGPGGAAVIATVETAFFRFDKRVNHVRIGAGNGHANAAERALGHAVAFDALPGCAVVVRTVETVLVTATVEHPRRAVAFPHCGEEHVGILRIENNVDAAGALVEVENFLPGLAAITGAEDAAFGVRAVGMAESGDQGDVGIRGMDDDLADVASVFQSHVVPGLAAVVRTIDAIAEGDVAANAGFAGPDVDYIGIGVGDRDAADGRGGLLVEEWIPGNTAVRGFPDAAGYGSKIVGVRLAQDSSHGKGPATAEWADEAPFHPSVGLGVDGTRDRRMVDGLSGRRAFFRIGDRGALGWLRRQGQGSQEESNQSTDRGANKPAKNGHAHLPRKMAQNEECYRYRLLDGSVFSWGTGCDRMLER